MSKEIEEQIITILVERGITFNIHYVGEKKNAFDSASSMDWWNVLFSTRGGQEQFEYFTGLGHRKWDKPFSAKKVLPYGIKEHNYTYQELGNPRSIHYEQMAKANLKPVVPHIAGVLYSLVLDSSALECAFEDWCSDFGYDTDSRKALDTYFQCQKLGKQLQSILDRATLDKIKTLLEDY